MTPTDHDALVSLRDYMDRCFAELEARLVVRCQVVDAKMEATERALSVAREVLDARLESMNLVREQLRDQAGHFASKETVEYNGKRIAALETQVAAVQGRNIGNMQLAVIAVATFITAGVTIVHMLWK